MDVIAYAEENGNLSIVIPHYAAGHTIESVSKTDAVPDSGHKIVDSTKMPSRLLRNAWKLNADKVDIDIPKGKEISHSLRRAARETALKDNIEIIKQGNAGIPLKAGQSVETAQSENAAYMLIDDANQVSIDNATNESDLLAVIDIL
jgi:hypothetical protein